MEATTLTSLENLEKHLENRRLVIVSNREPFQIIRQKDSLKLERTTGGLVSALDPILQNYNGLWICWNSEDQDQACSFEDLCRLAQLNQIELPYQIQTVNVTEEEVERYYYGFANRQIWPLFHYFPSRYTFDEADWESYCRVNQKFAQAIVNGTHTNDLIWIQDYHLMLTPDFVRQENPNINLGFFCHIPFPHYEIFRILPTRKALLKGILGSDLIGFHTPSYAKYFMECAEKLLPNEVDIIDPHTLHYQSRQIKVQAFPISIDYERINQIANAPEMASTVQQIKQTFLPAEFIGLGVDRLDYTKGILERLECIALFFERHPEYRKRLVFVQIAVPSRTRVQEYQQMKQEIDEAVGRINGRFSEDGWAPIHYLYRGFPMEELVAYYKAADFALVNPLRDGMNLVCKEYCAARNDEDGVLILSEMTGATHQLKESFLVNPYDHPGVVEAIYQALNASSDEKAWRMRNLRQNVERYNINQWLSDFLLEFAYATEHRDNFKR